MSALLVALTAAAGALTGCGVTSTGVVDAGEPASGIFSPSSPPPATAVVSLFFLRDGDLTAYPRRIGDAGDLEAVVRVLFEGPTASEAATATTELPRLTEAPRAGLADDVTVIVRLPGERTPLSRRGMLQLTCTVSRAVPALPTAAPGPSGEAETDRDAARASPGSGTVRVLGDGWKMTQPAQACPAGPDRPGQLSRSIHSPPPSG